MRTRYVTSITIEAVERGGVQPAPVQLGLLHLVTPLEAQALKVALLGGSLPADFERKLSLLEGRSFMHLFIAQNCRVFAMLLVAAYAGLFRNVSASDCDQILRTLAYVRKDEDLIPDYTTNGFTDDMHGVRGVMNRLQPLLSQFKAWRLRHQVPPMWRLGRRLPGGLAAA